MLAPAISTSKLDFISQQKSTEPAMSLSRRTEARPAVQYGRRRLAAASAMLTRAMIKNPQKKSRQAAAREIRKFTSFSTRFDDRWAVHQTQKNKLAVNSTMELKREITFGLFTGGSLRGLHSSRK